MLATTVAARVFGVRQGASGKGSIGIGRLGWLLSLFLSLLLKEVVVVAGVEEIEEGLGRA